MHSFERQQLLPQGYNNASPHARTIIIFKGVEDSLHVPQQCALPRENCWDRTTHTVLRMLIIISCSKVGSSLRTDRNITARVYTILYSKGSLLYLGKPGDFLEGGNHTVRLFYACAENMMPFKNWTELQTDPVMWYKRPYMEGLAPCAGNKLPNQKTTAVICEQIIPILMQLYCSRVYKAGWLVPLKPKNHLHVPRTWDRAHAKGFASKIDMINTEQLKK